ncbi:hypothetical protein CLOSTMETH_03567 [[Clostridium] methylpentosum DSM 5476]|uniref:Uncharacterized protein n=1 Tax=[Clostridium] methylpentosum DSM 5476 TaxID=537013 RepID=C0EI72_9FIRM|nr:hypothetical protein CLOSTMETH_03567 [[Clostridium] methylpentosum DSM 5476]
MHIVLNVSLLVHWSFVFRQLVTQEKALLIKTIEDALELFLMKDKICPQKHKTRNRALVLLVIKFE